jgi:hypothetical protein
MSSFTILFEGLICHVGTADAKTHAVMVVDPKGRHKPSLQLNAETPPIDLFKGDRITFSTGQGAAGTTANFQDRVPSLRPLIPSGYTIESKVFHAIPDPADNALAYIIFPDGVLDAPEVAFRPIDFDGPDELFLFKKCVAKGVRFTADAQATLKIEFGGYARKTLPLVDTDVVRIRNISDGTEGHFDLYKGLTTSPVIGAVHADINRQCKAKPDFDEGETLFPDKNDALIAGALKRGELSAAGATIGARRLLAADSSTASQADAVAIDVLTVPHAECSNSNWP